MPADRRTAALAEEIGFSVNTAACDLDYARHYASVAPQLGQPAEAYLDRWLPLASGTHVLAGPRYLGRDPELPFVGVAGSDRPLVPSDRDALIDLARDEFAPFGSKFVLLQSAEPVSAWPDCGTERRTVVGVLGELRAGRVDPGISTRPRSDLGMYETYAAIYRRDLEAHPERRRQATPEDRDGLAEIAADGLLLDVLVDGAWAGVIAAEIDARRGVPGAVIKELVLDQRYRGHGLGHQLSRLLARAVPLDDDELLLGTIHADNAAAYHAAISAGRVDVGGEIRIPV